MRGVEDAHRAGAGGPESDAVTAGVPDLVEEFEELRILDGAADDAAALDDEGLTATEELPARLGLDDLDRNGAVLGVCFRQSGGEEQGDEEGGDRSGRAECHMVRFPKGFRRM